MYESCNKAEHGDTSPKIGLDELHTTLNPAQEVELIHNKMTNVKTDTDHEGCGQKVEPVDHNVL